MRVLRWNGSVEAPGLREETIERPQVGPEEILIEVSAAGVTPSELQWYPTSHTKSGEKRDGAVPTHEFSGIVAELGAGARGFAIGEAVYGMNDWFSEGALADYCVTRAEWIAHKPKILSYEEAASVPIGALTAWQGLYDRIRLEKGERILIHGGAGTVGVFAVQLAKLRGARVTATASARNLDFVKELGADVVLDYARTPFQENMREVDAVFDTVGGETLRNSWGVLKAGGRLVTIAAEVENSSDSRDKTAFLLVQPSQEQLRKIGDLFEAGRLRAVVDAILPFEEAAAAYGGTLANRKGRGKLVVRAGKSMGTAAVP